MKEGEIVKTLGIGEMQCKAARGWCDRFMRGAGLSLRGQTLCCPKLPVNLNRKAVVEHFSRKCCVTSALVTPRVLWGGSAQISDWDLRSDSAGLDLEYSVIT